MENGENFKGIKISLEPTKGVKWTVCVGCLNEPSAKADDECVFDCTVFPDFSTAEDIVSYSKKNVHFCELIFKGSEFMTVNRRKNKSFFFLCKKGIFRSFVVFVICYRNFVAVVESGRSLSEGKFGREFKLSELSFKKLDQSYPTPHFCTLSWTFGLFSEKLGKKKQKEKLQGIFSGLDLISSSISTQSSIILQGKEDLIEKIEQKLKQSPNCSWYYLSLFCEQKLSISVHFKLVYVSNALGYIRCGLAVTLFDMVHTKEKK